MNRFRSFLIFIALISGIGAAYFGSVEITDYRKQVVANTSYDKGFYHNTKPYHETDYNVTSHSGINGGAIGLGLISGMCFIAAAITFIGKEEKDFYKN